jgi:threonine/homoserine/homoserine lactone efflux protein
MVFVDNEIFYSNGHHDQYSSYIGFAPVSLLIAISPGPSWVYSISTILGDGRKARMIGNSANKSGILCHAAATALGLSAIPHVTTVAFIELKYFGVAYLALCTISKKTRLAIAAESSVTSFWQI